MAAPIRSYFSVTHVVYLIGFLDLLGVSMVMPLIPKYCKELGASPTSIGMLGSVYGGMQLFSSPFVGQWSDVSGRRFVLLWCLLLSALGYVMLGLASGMFIMFLARLQTGTFKFSQDMSRNYLYDVIPQSERALVAGRFNAWSQMGFIVGPIIAGHIAEQTNGFHLNAMATALIFVLMWVIAFLFLPNTNKTITSQRDVKPKMSYDIMLRNVLLYPVTFLRDMRKLDWSSLWDIFAFRFLMGFAVMVYRTNLTLMLDSRFAVSPKVTGYIMSYSSVVGTVSGFLVGHIAGLYRDERRLLLHTAVLQTGTLAALTVAPSLWVLVACLAPLSLGNAVGRVALTDLTVERGRGHETGALLGLGASVLSVARMMSPAVGGVAQEVHVAGPGVVGTVCAVMAVLCLVAGPPKAQHEKTS